jgi:hypothetical protein
MVDITANKKTSSRQGPFKDKRAITGHELCWYILGFPAIVRTVRMSWTLHRCIILVDWEFPPSDPSILYRKSVSQN